jgi:hypothetical protein
MGDPVGNVLKIIEPIETKLSRNVFGTIGYLYIYYPMAQRLSYNH